MNSSTKQTTAAFFKVLILAVLALIWPMATYATDGHFLHGAGPVNEAMGGADTACFRHWSVLVEGCSVIAIERRLSFR